MKTPKIVGEVSPSIVGVGHTEVLTSEDFSVKQRKPKLLFFDIETSLIRIQAWQTYKANAVIIDEDWKMVSWSAKWQDGKHITKCLADYPDYQPGILDDKALVEDLAKLFNEADVIIGHNSNSFDIKRTHTRMVCHRIPPPPPTKTVDTIKVARKHFAFPSNSLKNIARSLGVDVTKMASGGVQLWDDCRAGEMKAWRKMKAYNKQDVIVLEAIYNVVRPWVTGHPNLAVMQEIESGCPNCGGTHLNRHGWSYTPTGARRRIQCVDCGHWAQGGHKKITSIR